MYPTNAWVGVVTYKLDHCKNPFRLRSQERVGSRGIIARPDEIVQGIDIGASDDAKGAGLIATAPAITYAELTERLQANAVVRGGAILEAQDDGPTPKYAVYFLTSWRRGYCILHVHYPEQPRLFRGLGPSDGDDPI